MSNIPPQSRWEESLDIKLCAIDIDGVLNDYPNCWVEWVNKTRGGLFKNLDELKSFMSYKEYKKLKQEYRNEGEYLGVPSEGSKDLFDNLIVLGYRIIILTSRPLDKTLYLAHFTKEWLNHYGLRYDYLISSKDKHSEVITRFPHLRFMIEDNRYIANLVAKWGYKVYLKNNAYNQGDTLMNVERIDSFMEVRA